MALPTLTEMKTALGITVTTYDTQIQGFLDTATPVIEDIVGPIAVASGQSRTYDGDVYAVLLPGPVSSVTSVVENGSAIADFVANEEAGIVYAGDQLAPRKFFPGTQNVVITYAVGSATVPANVKQAVTELVRFWWQKGRQGNRPSFGTAEVEEVYTPSGFAVPREVAEMCAPNPRLPGFA